MSHAHEIQSNRNVNLWWVRESAPDRLDADFGTEIERDRLFAAILGLNQEDPVPDLADLSQPLPETPLPDDLRRKLAALLGPLSSATDRATAAGNLQILSSLTERALDAASDSSATEIHLPYLNRRDWNDRFNILADTEFRTVGAAVVPAPLAGSAESFGLYTASLVAVAMEHPGGSQIGWQHSQQIAPQLAGAQTQLFPQGSSAFDGTATLELTLPVRAAQAWRRAPAERTPAYLPAHAHVSVSIQRALRQWVAWRCLSDATAFADTERMYPLLVYAATEPFSGRRRGEFTYDLLSPEWVYPALHFAGRPLRRMLDSIHDSLVSAGETVLAESYSPKVAKQLLIDTRKRHKALQKILMGEAQVVNHFLNFGIAIKEADRPRELVRLTDTFMEGLCSRLRHIAHTPDLSAFAPGLLIEATRALDEALGGEEALDQKIA